MDQGRCQISLSEVGWGQLVNHLIEDGKQEAIQWRWDDSKRVYTRARLQIYVVSLEQYTSNQVC